MHGVGPKRKKAILKAFGILKRLRAASVEEIAAVPGVGKVAAEAVCEALRSGRQQADG